VSAMYFMQCGWSGNDALWWRTGRCGYTTNIDDAHQFTETEARRVEKVRPPEDKAWPVGVVLARAHRAVAQHELPYESSTDAGANK